MATVTNPNPIITAGTFNGMWAKQLSIIFTDKNVGNIHIQWLPYNGSTLLALGGVNKSIKLPSNMPNMDVVITTLKNEIVRLSGKNTDIKTLSITAHDPTKPVAISIMFSDRTSYRIEDCFVLMQSDPIFAQVFTTMMGYFAQISGLPVQ